MLKLSVVAAAMAFATQASAHTVVSQTVSLPVIAAGGTTDVVLTCPHHQYVVAGGYQAGDGWTGSMRVTADEPGSTQSWAVEVTNNSGRPTVAGEVSITVSATCGSHPWH
ncbi:hypothetical protein V8J82_11875 [Gymnodinialimonas sp. 2305UL16-5]|uniref:hypothetical protein n=1 Tax=Gymnodinialimonas mytili TaxID=3126503 RepID=UPI0030AC2008